MADDSSQEKTEDATPRRLKKAREEGQVPRSRDLSTTAVLLSGSIALLIFGPYMARGLKRVLEYNFSLERETLFDSNAMIAHLAASFLEALIAVIPLFAVVLVAALVGPIALGGWLMSAKALAPKLNRLDPLSGLKRMFSAKSMVELVKAIGKIAVVITAAFLMLQAIKTQLLGLSQEDIQSGMAHSVMLSVFAAIVLSASTLFIVIIDVPFQIWDHAKKMRMSRQEIKDEMKDTEGKPEVKSRIRRMQMELSQRRMMAEVPKADVVITNPTHFAVALRYDPDTMETPVLLAKGVDQVALKIREIANEYNIEKIESPILARAIYYTTELEGVIPQGLYVAVAQVLAYVFQLRDYRKGKGERPVYPRRLNIPPDLSRF